MASFLIVLLRSSLEASLVCGWRCPGAGAGREAARGGQRASATPRLPASRRRAERGGAAGRGGRLWPEEQPGRAPDSRRPALRHRLPQPEGRRPRRPRGPRTLHLLMSGMRDMSIIATPPPALEGSLPAVAGDEADGDDLSEDGQEVAGRARRQQAGAAGSLEVPHRAVSQGRGDRAEAAALGSAAAAVVGRALV